MGIPLVKRPLGCLERLGEQRSVAKLKADYVIVDLMLALTIAQVRAYCLIIGCGTIWTAIMLHRGKWPTYSINDLSWISFLGLVSFK